jgi:hypothetical protein
MQASPDNSSQLLTPSFAHWFLSSCLTDMVMVSQLRSRPRADRQVLAGRTVAAIADRLGALHIELG